jgi:hypothetical protein
MNVMFRFFPWVLVLILSLVLYFFWPSEKPLPLTQEITSHTLLESVETMGKLELVKYNFQKITEVKRLGKQYWQLIKVDVDSKIVLISKGEATACVDLTKVTEQDIVMEGDSVVLYLPQPELCYFKLDLDKTRVYALETGFFIDQKEFVQEAYKIAEREIREDALKSGILENATLLTQNILRPLLEKTSGKKVIVRHKRIVTPPKVSVQ